MSGLSRDNRPRLSPLEYTVGWISALSIEHAAAAEMLDEEHEPPALQDHDQTLYTLGKIHDHNVVIACLPAGLIGIASAASIATRLASRFPNAKIGLMVGIGGGVPSNVDIRLGDVVVSQPGHGDGGVIQYDMGKRLPDGKFEQTSYLDQPPAVLLNALNRVQSNHARELSTFVTYLSKLERKAKFSRQRAGPDRLFQSAYQHEGPSCAACDKQKLIERDPRFEDEEVQFHYGTIASANSLVKDGVERDRICQALGDNILCFEMEAAGLMNNFPCLVIRGICDYADSHKNKMWQPYAAATAAAYAKEILSVIPPKEVASSAPIKAPWVLPFNINPRFTGRGDIIRHLHQCLQDPEQHPHIAIYGLGGSGKSAVAIEFAHEARDKNPSCAIFWVSSFTIERFQESYREIARALQIPGADDLEKDVLEPVRRKLTGEDQRKWLMIVDNVDDGKVLLDTEINCPRLYDYLPRNRRGTILFTTRSRKIAVDLAPNDNHMLGAMLPSEAKDLLYKSLKDGETPNSEDVDEFLKILTYVPIAIIQALAYIKKNDSSIKHYTKLFRSSGRSKLLRKHFEDINRDTESLNAVFLTWEITFRRIQQEDKLAADYLSYLACIEPQNIPRSIFPSAPSDDEQEEAIGTLTGYTFLTKRKEEGLYDMHMLIHQVTQDWLKDSKRWTEIAQKSVKSLAQLIPPGGQEQSKQYPLYLSHGLFATEIIEIIEEKDTINLLDNIGRCYQSLGKYSNAVLTHQKVLERLIRTIGLKQRTTLICMNELGLGLNFNGNYVEAEKILLQTLDLQTEVLGVEHPDTLTSMGNLALTYRNQGRWKEAEDLEVQVMETRKRVLGLEHPDTLTSMGNLASTYRNQGRWKEAEELEVQVMETSKRVLGQDHPSTLTGMSNLASTYRNQGRWKEAEELGVQVMETRKRVLGQEHPNTLTSMGNLALTYGNQGRWKEAEDLEVQLMETRKRVLGQEHPDTLTSMGNVASTYGNQGRWKEAEELGVQVIETSSRVLGQDHPDTLTSMGNLALTFWNQGRWKEAEELEVQVMETSKRVLGQDHPSTLTSMNNLAVTWKSQGKEKEALQMMEECLRFRTNSIDRDHPYTRVSFETLKQWRNISS